jgi:type I restriction enzyme S subunit
MEKELPKNWVETELGNLITLMNGYAFKSTDYSDVGIPIIRMSDIENNEINILKSVRVAQKKEYDKFIINRGDILIGMSGSIGKYGIFNLNEKVYLNQRVGNLRLISENHVNKKLIYYFIGQFQKEIAENAYGGTVPNISGSQIENFNFKLPPLSEQNRIVEKLDRLFAQLECIKSSMEKIPVLLKNFRQQILTQAIISTDTIKLKKVLIDIKYGTSKKSDYEIIGTPILRIPNIDNGYINDSDLKFSVLDKKELETLKLQENDILIIRSNGSVTLVGQSAIVTKEFESYSYAGYLIRIRLNEQYNSKYLNYIFKSNFIRSQMIDTSRSTSGINNINSKEIQDLDVPNIKVEEQKEIVSRVESLFSKADAIEEKYKNLKAKIETLPQTILHKAFKGELSEQLESDGDARDLLEEIMELKRMK